MPTPTPTPIPLSPYPGGLPLPLLFTNGTDTSVNQATVSGKSVPYSPSPDAIHPSFFPMVIPRITLRMSSGSHRSRNPDGPMGCIKLGAL